MKYNDFSIHKLSGAIETIFIAEYKDKILIMDGGSSPDVELIENFIINDLQRKMEEVKLIFVSHTHPDHCGAIHGLRDKYGMPVASYKYADLWYKGVGGFIQHRIDTALAHFVAKRNGKPHLDMRFKRFVKADYLLKNGDILPEFPDWKTFHTPGHTTNDMVLYHEQEKILYAADIVLKVGKKCLLPFPITIPQLMAKSLMKISHLDVKTMLLAHGDICETTNFKESIEYVMLLISVPQNFFLNVMKRFSRFSPNIKKVKKLIRKKEYEDQDIKQI